MLKSMWPILILLLEFGFRLFMVAVVLVRARLTPSSRVAWVVTILMLPIFGATLYLLIGEVRLGRRRMERHAECSRRVIESSWKSLGHRDDDDPNIEHEYTQIATLARTVNDTSPKRGNALRLISETDLFVQNLVEDIDEAKHHCHVLTYIMLTDHSSRRVGQALIRAAKRGVDCRLLVDSVGSKLFLRSDLRQEMFNAGVQVVEALPANLVRMAFARVDVRNHRKIAVIDGLIGYLGSHNIADAEFAIKPKFAPWVDTSMRIQGPIVRDLQAIFLIDWYLDTDEFVEQPLEIEPPRQEADVTAQVIGTGPSSYTEALNQVLISAFHTAREELLITTPYFVPDEMMLRALRATARRGVDVKIILPKRNDSPLVGAASHSMYEPMMESGVKLFEYGTGLLHAKTLTVDRDFAIIGSANMDRRSFELNFEISLIVYDTDVSSQLRFLQHAYLAESEPVSHHHWASRPWPQRAWQNAVGILSPLL